VLARAFGAALGWFGLLWTAPVTGDTRERGGKKKDDMSSAARGRGEESGATKNK
jgi:hypothetical protein